MSEAPFLPYRIILIRGGELSPAEDFGTAHRCGKTGARAMAKTRGRSSKGDDVILEGTKLAEAIANH